MRKLFVAITAVCFAASVSYLVQSSSALTNGASITTLGAALTENFDTLAQTGTNIAWADNSTIPGWYSTRITYNSGTGSSNTGALYSFGVAGTNPVTDRALGSVASGGTGTVFQGAKLTNNTGSTITSLAISYAGEQWRNGGNATAHALTFQYQVANGGVVTGANSPTSGWTTFAPLSFTGPITGATAATLDGNAPANRLSISATLPVTATPGQEIWLRWQDPDDAGNDHGLAIDDFSVTANGVPPGDTAPAVTTTMPADGTNNVPVNSNVVINFSEPVNATFSAVAIECPAGSPQAFTQSTSPSATFTLTLASALPFSTVCAVTVTASQITDTDTNDPPDQLAANVSFSFTTASPTDTAPAITGTTPADLASNVGVHSNVVINFSESVNASTSAFTIQCPAGSPLTFTQSASPSSTFTLAPSSAFPYSTTCTVTITASQISDLDTNDPPDQLAADMVFSFTTADPPPPVATNIIINEIDSDTPDADNAEFVELYDGGVGNTRLDGLVVVFFNGSNDLSYAAFDLDGYSTNVNGYFTLGNPGVPGVDLLFNPGAAGLLQNGQDAVALYVGDATSFPNGTNVTTANLQDAVVYETDDPEDPGLLVLLNADQPQVDESGGGNSAGQSIQRCANGSGGARNTSSYITGTPTPDGVNSCPLPPTPSNSIIVVSQLYGGGGNTGATYQNDYVELFNRGSVTVDIGGWSLQYASFNGSGWDSNKQPLGGTIAPGQYYLIALAGGPIGASLPPANITGEINMSGTNGKIALVSSFVGLSGNCPLNDPSLMDFVGYGTADCQEGSSTAPAPSTTTSLFRLNGGSTDTDRNGNDFVTGSPMPRQTAPIVELGPLVLSTDPFTNRETAPRDATIEVTFTEPVDVIGPWFDITCTTSGQHNSATQAGAGKNHYITPNVNFIAGEQCTVSILKDQVHDLDLDDSLPNTDTLPATYTWSFTVSSGTEPPYPSNVHLLVGNPSGAATSLDQPNNYLMEKPEFALSYSRDLGRPNWVSWHLSDEWVGSLMRVDSFRADPEVPAEWYRVQSFDFVGSGFDRGHMTPNADRDKETSIPINQATFLMSNMVAQAPDNNQGPWASLENYLRTLLPANEIYIVAGGTGIVSTIANGHVSVPASTWKVALVIPKGSDDISRVSCSSRTIAVNMPNIQGIRNDPWEKFLTTIDAVEGLTGYNLFSNLPQAIQACVEAGFNGNNPPLDSIAPIIICPSLDGAWHLDNVTFTCTASDGGSGLANASDASFSLSTSVGSGVENDNAGTSSRVVCDVAGNCATAVIDGNKIDRKGPVIMVSTPSTSAVYQLNQDVTAAYECSDGGSGKSGCSGTVANLSALDTNTLGSKTFVVNATDAAGNTSSTTVTYDVRRTLSAVDTAKVWVGLKNSDDVGLRLDLHAELRVDGVVAARGDLSNIASGSSGFNNAILNSVPLALASGPLDVPAGAQVEVAVSTRRTCFGPGHNSGTAREWLNGQPVDSGAGRDAGSRIRFTLAGMATDYFLRTTSPGLNITPGSAKTSIDAAVNSSAACPSRPFTALGSWSVTLP